MAEGQDKDSKTEEATEKKVRDALEKGNVPFSREAATLASMLGILVITSFFLGSNVLTLNFTLKRLLDNAGEWPLENGPDVIRLFAAIGTDVVRLFLPIVIVLAIAGILSSFLQNQPRLVVNRILPDLSRLSLAKGWTRIFGIQGHVEFLKAVFKLAAITILGVIMLRAARNDVLNAQYTDPGVLPVLILNLTSRLVATVAVATVVLVAADLVWSRVFWQRELKMTRQEVKDEMKQSEGDPIVKSRLRSLARDRMRNRMMAAVPRATLVIANPTHYAVALRYVREEGGAPLVVAKGQDLIALKIKEIATQNGIPIVEDKLLARSLFKVVEVDKMIPPEFYKAVAEVVLFLVGRSAERRPAG